MITENEALWSQVTSETTAWETGVNITPSGMLDIEDPPGQQQVGRECSPIWSLHRKRFQR